MGREKELEMNTVEIMLKVLKDTNELGFIHSFEELEDAIAVGEAELKREPVAWLDTNRWEFVSGARSPVAQFPGGNWVPLYTPTIGETK